MIVISALFTNRSNLNLQKYNTAYVTIIKLHLNFNRINNDIFWQIKAGAITVNFSVYISVWEKELDQLLK